MKTLLTLVAVIGSAGAVLGQQPSPAPRLGPEYKVYEVCMGDWQYEGEAEDSPMGPGGKFSGKATGRWVLDGCFMEWRAQEKGNLGDLEAIELYWYDAAAKNHRWQGYINNGDAYSGAVTVSGHVWNASATQTHNGSEYKYRQVTIFAADGKSYAWKTEVSTDGKTWAFWNEGKATKLARATAAAVPKVTNISTAGKTTEAASTSAQVKQQLIDLENGWGKALVKRDLAFLNQILADEYTATWEDGTVVTRGQVLGDLQSGAYTVASSVSNNMEARVYGDMAVVIGLSTEKSQFKGKDSSGQYQWTDTWIKRDGRWQCVAGHSSKVAAK